MLTWITEQFNNIWNAISSVLTQAWNWAVEQANRALSAALEFALNLYGMAVDWAQSLFNGAVAIAMDVYGRAVAAAQQLFGIAALRISQGILTAISAAQHLFDIALLRISQGILTAISAAQHLFDIALLRISQGILTAISAAQHLFDIATLKISQAILSSIALVDELKRKIGIDSAEGERTLWSLVTDPFGTLIAYIGEFLLDLFFWLLAEAFAPADVDIGAPPSFFNFGSGGLQATYPIMPSGESGLVPPVSPVYVSGYRFTPIHPGLDLGLVDGQPVYAMHDGTVVHTGWDPDGYGWYVVLQGGDWWTLYGHARALNVSPGDQVIAGQVIALGDSTGNSTGPHLHLEIKLRGRYIDPLSVL